MNITQEHRKKTSRSLCILTAMVTTLGALFFSFAGCDAVPAPAVGPATTDPADTTDNSTNSGTQSNSSGHGTVSNSANSSTGPASDAPGRQSGDHGGAGSDDGDIDTEPSNPWGDNVTLVAFSAYGTAELEGDLSDGAPLADLSWADDSNVACFTGPQFPFFKGNQVFYALESPQPAGSIVTITVTPDPDVEVSVYGYTASATSYPLPPMKYSTTCEASLGSTLTGPNPGVAESIEFHNPTGNEYNIFFAVSGDAYTGTAGHYEVIVELIDAY